MPRLLFLTSHGLLGKKEVKGGLPFPRGREWHVRCIDDLKLGAVVPRDAPGGPDDALPDAEGRRSRLGDAEESGRFAEALRAAARRSVMPACTLTAADARPPEAFFTGRPDREAIWRALQAYSKEKWPVSEDKIISDTTQDVVLGGEVDGEVARSAGRAHRR